MSLNNKESEMKAMEDHSKGAYMINVIQVESITVMPQAIDCISLMHLSAEKKPRSTPVRKFLPKKLKAEVTDEQIDVIYENIKRLNKGKGREEERAIFNKILSKCSKPIQM